MSTNPRKVSIIYRMLPQYRVDFYERLRISLSMHDICLDVYYGTDDAGRKGDQRELAWGMHVRQNSIPFFGTNLIYQHVPRRLYGSDLIIMGQENKILSNMGIAWRARGEGRRLAFWGHGRNFQQKPNSLSNWVKSRYSASVDWWFAYTEGSARVIRALPFPADRITVVKNAIDTRSLAAATQNLSQVELGYLRSTLKIGSGPVGIYCGAMYYEKRMAFLLEACQDIRRRIPGFEMLLIGAGPDAHIAEDFSRHHAWAHYVGPKFGMERVPYFALAEVQLMPGLVGLAVLDSFALGTPIITTRYEFHSPEIEYLESGRNGLVTENTVAAYAAAVADMLESPERLAIMRENARNDAQQYTIEDMVARYSHGIVQALKAPRRADVQRDRARHLGFRARPRSGIDG